MIERWFSTPIYFNFVENYEEKNKFLERRAYELLEKYDSNVETSWRCDTFNTLNQDHKLNNEEDKMIADFIDEISQHVFEFSREFGIDPEKHSLTCKDFWFNVSKPQNYQEYHQHPNTHFSVVYYVKAAKNSGNIVFKSFEDIIDAFPLPGSAYDKNCHYAPDEGKLLIFRSNILHMVEKNMSNSDRISIAANFVMS